MKTRTDNKNEHLELVGNENQMAAKAFITVEIDSESTAERFP